MTQDVGSSKHFTTSKKLSVAEQLALTKRFARAFLANGRWSSADIDDFIGDALLNLVLRPLGPVDERGEVPILIQRVRWSLLDSLRRRHRQAEVAKKVEEQLLHLQELSQPPVNDAKHEVEVETALRALRAIHPADSELVIRTVAFAETMESAAARTGVSPSGALQRRNRALARVRARCSGGGRAQMSGRETISERKMKDRIQRGLGVRGSGAALGPPTKALKVVELAAWLHHSLHCTSHDCEVCAGIARRLEIKDYGDTFTIVHALHDQIELRQCAAEMVAAVRSPASLARDERIQRACTAFEQLLRDGPDVETSASFRKWLGALRETTP